MSYSMEAKADQEEASYTFKIEISRDGRKYYMAGIYDEEDGGTKIERSN